MTTLAATILRIATNGVTKQTLTTEECAVLRRSWRYLPSELSIIAHERAALYALANDGFAMAVADVLTAKWQIQGIDMSVSEWCRLVNEIGDLYECSRTTDD